MNTVVTAWFAATHSVIERDDAAIIYIPAPANAWSDSAKHVSSPTVQHVTDNMKRLSTHMLELEEFLGP